MKILILILELSGELIMLFLIISIAVFNGICFIMPKRLTKLEMYATSLFALFLEYIANYVFDFIHKIYGYFKPGIDILSFVVVIGVYPAINMIFLNYYPYKSKAWIKICYVMFYSLFALFYEWLSLKSKYFYHSGWSLWYSLVLYPIIFGIMALNYKLIRILIRRGEGV